MPWILSNTFSPSLPLPHSPVFLPSITSPNFISPCLFSNPNFNSFKSRTCDYTLHHSLTLLSRSLCPSVRPTQKFQPSIDLNVYRQYSIASIHAWLRKLCLVLLLPLHTFKTQITTWHSPGDVNRRTRPDTRPIPVADGWAGAEMRFFALSQLDDLYGPTEGPTDGQSLL